VRRRASHGSWTAALAALIVIAAPLTADEGSSLDGMPIVRIIFVRNDIFDTSVPKTSGWFYRAANSLHIVSREGFIRYMLLFREGDPYSAQLADESARLLRSLGIINPVHIAARPVEGGVEVTVETRDQWTLEPGISFGLSGNRSELKIEFREQNLLGWGKELEFKYKSDNERSTWIYGYKDPNILGTRWRTELRYEDSSDGFREVVHVDRPFFSLATQRSWGTRWERQQLIEHLYAESESVVSGPRDSELWMAWYGFRLPTDSGTTRRLVAGFEHHHDVFGDWSFDASGLLYPSPDDRLVDGPRLSFEQVLDRFVVLRGFRSWTIQEDVALGPNFSAGVTWSRPEFGGDIPRWLFDGAASAAWRRNGWLVLGKAWFEGRIDDGDPRNWIAGAQVGLAQLGRSGWQARLLAETSHELDLDRQLTLGADVGLRGWNPDYFDGTGRAVANLQWRTLLKEDLFNILAIGIELFADAGVTWNPRVGRSTVGLRKNLGVGVVGDLTTIGLTNLLRLEVGIPDDGSGVTVIVTSESLF
jgi:hypothetical protein